jgi:hypothetical protein
MWALVDYLSKDKPETIESETAEKPKCSDSTFGL